MRRNALASERPVKIPALGGKVTAVGVSSIPDKAFIGSDPNASIRHGRCSFPWRPTSQEAMRQMLCHGIDRNPDEMEPGELNDIRSRVLAEFREMPGLILTLPQAVRLFGVEGGRCQHILGVLVDDGVLTTDGKTFARADGGTRNA